MKLLFKEPMKEHTTFKIGGLAEVFAIPQSIEELSRLIIFLRKEYINYYILGNGSNVLVSDKGIKGCVVHIGEEISKIKRKGNRLEIEAGASMAQIGEFCLENGLTGFEQLAGIPGTIGGAIAMNAGAYGKEISDILVSIDAINENGEINIFKKNELGLSYRKSTLIKGDMNNDYIVTSVYIALNEDEPKKIRERMDQYWNLRKEKQPLEYPSAGSTFKRPENGFASLLIKESGLTASKVGDAMVSEKHAGFIVNLGNAKANDVYKLIKKVQEGVKVYYNILLEPEVKIWGKFA